MEHRWNTDKGGARFNLGNRRSDNMNEAASDSAAAIRVSSVFHPWPVLQKMTNDEIRASEFVILSSFGLRHSPFTSPGEKSRGRAVLWGVA